MPPNPLLERFAPLILEKGLEGPVLDLACGEGQNGLYLAELGLPVILADRDATRLRAAQENAKEKGLEVTLWEKDLENGENPFQEEHYRAILVFRYLHRPLIPCIKKGIRQGGFLFYETFTIDQARYGHPHNPAFLLKPGELQEWFKDWHVIHYFEGLLEDPTRAMAQIICRKLF
ncbi:MAG TPA: methyltransferase domain-containing protein [Thermodesulfobacteriota bacterium]|nr:methyltransferase domain-containing protein [Thermodesulfobacteriota bacterium]